MHTSLRFDQGARTDAGCVRAVNEDAFFARSDDAVWAVADGMGGHAKGRWASAQIAAALEACAFPTDLDGAIDAARGALEQANVAIYGMSQAEARIIGSTVALLLIRDHRYAVIWAGDSRIYRLRDGVMLAVTTDHSEVEQMVASGLISREEADGHPMAHMLSRAVGVREGVDLDVRTGDVRSGDSFLLCSDGLVRTMRESELAAMLARETPRRAVDRLVGLALERGAADNVTAIVVGCDETTHVVTG